MANVTNARGAYASPLESEELLARLTRAAYEVALRRGFRGPFIDVELELWEALRSVVDEVPKPEHRVPALVGRGEAVAWPA